MNEPTCPACGPDYLRITRFTPGRIDQVPFRTSQGTIYKPRETSPQAFFFCRKCGRSNGHSVPPDWSPPTKPISDDEIFDELGVVWLTEHQEKIRNADGSTVIHGR